MIYERKIAVEFNHCDPAGIVFYPRYFEMTNSVVENFFAEVVGFSFAKMMVKQVGIPTARIEVNFLAPSQLGDQLAFSLQVQRIGRASATLRITGICGSETRLIADITLVWVNNAVKVPAPWPAAIRDILTTYSEAA